MNHLAIRLDAWCDADSQKPAVIQIQRREDLVLKVAPDVAHPVVSVVFPLSIQDPCVYRCFLVGAQSLYEFRRSTGRPRPSSLVIDLYGKAITALQSRLSEQSAYLDDNVLFSIVHLMIASVSQGADSTTFLCKRSDRQLGWPTRCGCC